MKAVVVCNWKMQPATMREAKNLFEATKKAADKAKSVQVIVAPPVVFLRELSKGYRGKIAFGVQNASISGSFTGEISFEHAKDSRAEYAILGHTERRHMGETNETVRAKVKAALEIGIAPILCVGEEIRSVSGEHFKFVKEELRTALNDVATSNLKRMFVAYEPAWAVGAPKPMEPRAMHEMAIFIRKSIVETHGEAGMEVKILYGGAIDDTNAVDMLREGDVRGFLVGRASSEPQHVTKLLETVANA